MTRSEAALTACQSEDSAVVRQCGSEKSCAASAGAGPSGALDTPAPASLESVDAVQFREILAELAGKTDAASMRKKILAIEAVMLQMTGHTTELPVVHHFTPGIYMRELRIPRGTVLTGKIHRTEHLNILSQGEITVWTEDGMKHLGASTVIKSQPGMKRVGYAHSDCVWITVHHNPTEEKDPEKLVEMLTAKTFEEALGFSAAPEQIAGGTQ